MIRLAHILIAALLLVLAPAAALAQNFPKFDDSGVVDAANILTPQQRQALSTRLIEQKKTSGRSLFVATIPDLQGYDISDYGYQLGRAWAIGGKENDGVLLIVAPNDRKVRIEVGYGLEGILTDAVSSQIIRNQITPRFKAGDMAGGIAAGTDALATLLTLPPDEARQRALAAEKAQRESQDDGGTVMLVFWIIVILFIVIPMFFGRSRGRRYRGGSGPVIIWGGSDWGSGGGGGWGSSGGGGWGGGSSGGGFSGGGSFGGGGASGDW